MASSSFQKPPSRPGGLTTNTIYSQKAGGGNASFDGFDQVTSKFNHDSKKMMNLTTDGNFARPYGGGRNDETTKFYGSTKAGTAENVNLFCESIVEQAQLKKPAFNTGTFRLPNEATREGFVRFNPGPGSYSTRVNSIGS